MVRMKNYYKQFQEIVNGLTYRSKLLLHACCGPCSVYPLVLLDKYFDITIYYSNDNIYPNSEYLKRLSELERYLDILKAEHNIKLVVPPSNQEAFLKKIAKYGNEKEGYHRCVMCYALRMQAAFKYAKQEKFDYCTTVMSISNHKNANYIDELGHLLEKEYGVKYLVADFKKGDGININNQMNAELDLYHQDYCGCIYSYLAKKYQK